MAVAARRDGVRLFRPIGLPIPVSNKVQTVSDSLMPLCALTSPEVTGSLSKALPNRNAKRARAVARALSFPA